ncbi:MAG TPA: sugar phosphate isomerase/epimerase [Candidatus Acidoferrales bacterium]|nr:sugar phosphate isomerase/epimerase [Candidatus Acidoferrales bacterium]
MRVSISCATLDLGRLEDVKNAGFDGWEVIAEGSQTLNRKTLSVIDAAFHSYGLKISIHTPISDMNIASLNYPIWRETIHQIKKSISKTSDYANIFVIHPGYISQMASHNLDKALKRNNEGLKSIASTANNLGVKATVENMVNVNFLMGKYPEEIKNMMNNEIGFTFDVGHANTANAINDFLKMKIDHVHVHDNNGNDDEHLILGRGNIDWKHVIGELKGYKGDFVVEANDFEAGIKSLRYLTSL